MKTPGDPNRSPNTGFFGNMLWTPSLRDLYGGATLIEAELF